MKKIKSIIVENKIFIIVYIILLILTFFPLPYIIYSPAELTNIEDRISVDNNFKLTGSFNMSAVKEMNATPINCLLALINSWDILEKEVVDENELGNRILLDSSFDKAIIASFNDKNIIKNEEYYIVYIYDEAKTDLKIGDKILKINDNVIKTKNDILNIINNSNENDILRWEVERDKEIIRCTTKVQKYKDKLIAYLYIAPKYVIETNPKIKQKFPSNEFGPSGGMMFSLYIYSKINKIDLTKNKIIAGSGTIDENGEVGDIDGIKYKLKGAVLNNADIFLVHNGDNYKEAIKEKKENKYTIKVYGVDTLEEAINILKKAS